MIYLDLIFLVLLVIAGVFITGWLMPLVLVVINRLIMIDIDPFLILWLCMVGGAIWNTLLWYFDDIIHSQIEKRLKIKKHDHVLAKKKWIIRILSHKLWDRFQLIQNKYIMFFGVMCASFTFIPDFFIVDFSHKKMKMPTFVSAMFIWKVVTYAPLIWGSIGFIEVIKFYA